MYVLKSSIVIYPRIIVSIQIECPVESLPTTIWQVLFIIINLCCIYVIDIFSVEATLHHLLLSSVVVC
jgi:hypothetical protein